ATISLYRTPPSEHGAVLNGRFRSEAVAGLRFSSGPEDLRCNVFAQRRAVLEPMTGPSTNEPNVLQAGMQIVQELAVRAVLVLADARFHKRRILESGEQVAQAAAHFDDLFPGDEAVGGIGVERRAVPVVGDLESSVLEIGNAVEVDVDPGGHGGRRPAAVA